jgi:hypothetical protein
LQAARSMNGETDTYNDWEPLQSFLTAVILTCDAVLRKPAH